MMKNIERKKKLIMEASIFESLPPVMVNRMKEIIDESFRIVDIMNSVSEGIDEMVEDGVIDDSERDTAKVAIWKAMAMGGLGDMLNSIRAMGSNEEIAEFIDAVMNSMINAGIDPNDDFDMFHEMDIDFSGWKYQQDAERLINKNKYEGNDRNALYDYGPLLIAIKPGEGGGTRDWEVTG